MDRFPSGKSLPNLNEIFKGEIVAVKEYGAFVKMPGYSKDGLVHKSQLSKFQVDNVSEVVSVGDKVWCKVTSVGENEKVSLSMKLVDQGNGKDLDPNGVEMSLGDKRKRAFVPHSQPKIQLEAVYNTTCRKCGTKGHLAQDCFHTPGGKSYELLTDTNPDDAKESKKLEDKKDTKEKDKRKRKYSDSSSDSSTSSSEHKHKRKKEKCKVKRKKKKSHSKKKKHH